jgi:hypothetical protein
MIGLPILLEEICRPILGLYKSFTEKEYISGIFVAVLSGDCLFNRRTEEVCSEVMEPGRCEEEGMNRTLAVWGYSVVLRRCVPFYFTGCQAQTVK